jgi:hypothetical protein
MGKMLVRFVVVALAAALSLAPRTGLANGAYTQTDLTIRQTEVVAFTDPCTGSTSPVTIDSTSLFHITVEPVNTLQVIINTEGTFETPTASGHFVAVNTFAGGPNDVMTAVLVAEGTASDGSHVSIRFDVHMTQNGGGITVVSFQKGCA